jgi:hypothetical protein
LFEPFTLVCVIWASWLPFSVCPDCVIVSSTCALLEVPVGAFCTTEQDWLEPVVLLHFITLTGGGGGGGFAKKLRVPALGRDRAGVAICTTFCERVQFQPFPGQFGPA